MSKRKPPVEDDGDGDGDQEQEDRKDGLSDGAAGTELSNTARVVAARLPKKRRAAHGQGKGKKNVKDNDEYDA